MDEFIEVGSTIFAIMMGTLFIWCFIIAPVIDKISSRKGHQNDSLIIQEQQEKINELKEENTQLKAELKERDNKQAGEREKDFEIEGLKKQIETLNRRLIVKEERIQKLTDENTNLQMTVDRVLENNRKHLATIQELSDENRKNEQAALSLKQWQQMWEFKNQAREVTRAINKTFHLQYNVPSFFESVTQNRLNRAFQKDIVIDRFSCEVYIHSGNEPYQVSLTQCTCQDYTMRRRNTPAGNPVDPCKHMLFLAYTLGLLQNSYQERNLRINRSIESLNTLTAQIAAQKEKNRMELALEKELDTKIKQHEQVLAEYKQEIQEYVQEECAGHPKLAGAMADLETLYYKRSAQYLMKKHPPAPTEAKRIQELQRETKKYITKQKEAEYKLAYLKQLFPNIDIVFEQDFVPNKWFKIEYCPSFNKDDPSDTFD